QDRPGSVSQAYIYGDNFLFGRAHSSIQRSRSEKFRCNCSSAKSSARSGSDSSIDNVSVSPWRRSDAISELKVVSVSSNASSDGGEQRDARAPALLSKYALARSPTSMSGGTSDWGTA